MNIIKLQGNATREPRITPAKDGSIVAHFTVAVNRPDRRKADFIPVTAFGDVAETINSRVTTGTHLEIIGHVDHSAKFGTSIVATYAAAGDGALVVE